MNKSIQKFLEKVEQDPALLAKMRAIQDPDEAYKVASSVQDGFTKEEFMSAMKELLAANADLSDDDLNKFAGGTDTKDVESIASSVLASFSLSMGAAATAAI